MEEKRSAKKEKLISAHLLITDIAAYVWADGEEEGQIEEMAVVPRPEKERIADGRQTKTDR